MSNDATMQVAVEAPHEWARVIRVAGSLDRAAAAGLLRLIDAQLDLAAARLCRVSDLIVDLEHVRSFEPGGLESIRHAWHSTGARKVRIHLAGCSARFHLLPLRACQILAEVSTFPTVEIALAELAAAPATLNPAFRRGADTTGAGAAPRPLRGPRATPLGYPSRLCLPSMGRRRCGSHAPVATHCRLGEEHATTGNAETAGQRATRVDRAEIRFAAGAADGPHSQTWLVRSWIERYRVGPAIRRTHPRCGSTTCPPTPGSIAPLYSECPAAGVAVAGWQGLGLPSPRARGAVGS